MGGDALPFPTQRLTPERYKDVSQRLLALLSTHYALACIPALAPGKTSYGDVDILVALPHADRPFDPATQLNSRAVVRNGPMVSFEFEGHQADVICVREGDFALAQLMYGYGDAGMILGRTLSARGVKLGYHGLLLVRPDNGGQLLLSTDRSRILAWLGLSEADWLAGFDDERAVFEWLRSCRWFHHSLFGARLTTRGARPMFARFVQHVDALTPPDDTSECASTAAVQADAVSHFGCEAAVAALDAAAAKRAALKARWNGELVSARTGLTGKQLGLFMMSCRQRVTDDELLNMRADEVERFIDSSRSLQCTS